MEGDAKKVMWTVGAQMLALAIGLLTVYLIVWAASKAWKKGSESGYDYGANLGGTNWLESETGFNYGANLGGTNYMAPYGESGYNAPGYSDNWLGY